MSTGSALATGGAGPIVLVSASIPDPERWTGDFDALSITDAVVAASRAVFTHGGTILTAAHPTIAPLILQVGDGFPGRPAGIRVILYQSELFLDSIPAATREMMQRPYVDVRWTAAAAGDRPVPGSWDASLSVMRYAMLSERPIVAAIFIGGMEGIRDEFERVGTSNPGARRFALTRPGGAAASLEPNDLPAVDTSESDLYPLILDTAVAAALGRAQP